MRAAGASKAGIALSIVRRENRPFEVGEILSVDDGIRAHRTEGPYGSYQHTPLAVDVVVPLEIGIGPLPDHLLAEHAQDQQSRQKGHRQASLGEPRLAGILAAGQEAAPRGHAHKCPHDPDRYERLPEFGQCPDQVGAEEGSGQSQTPAAVPARSRWAMSIPAK